ncbi:AhpC/TSA family protein [Ectothiorhodospiraceae bacterium WFHF3C12]|nr:AhpC/TSA family protein [Ectothiorhodospiraceae bacterium WFHF3C12]
MQSSDLETAVDFETRDIYGEAFRLGDLRGRRVMLSFFRDAACPFCNLRIYEMTHRYTEWRAAGMRVVAVFSSPAEQVRSFVARRPRPFFMISDPTLEIYARYGVQQSTAGLFKALALRMPRILGGIAKGGRPRPNPHVRLVPADFLIDEEGQVVESWYGRDTSDHLPLERVQAFAEAGRERREQRLMADGRTLSETREALAISEQRLEGLRREYAALERQFTDLQLKNRTLGKILEAYKHGDRSDRAAEARQLVEPTAPR